MLSVNSIQPSQNLSFKKGKTLGVLLRSSGNHPRYKGKKSAPANVPGHISLKNWKQFKGLFSALNKMV